MYDASKPKRFQMGFRQVYAILLFTVGLFAVGAPFCAVPIRANPTQFPIVVRDDPKPELPPIDKEIVLPSEESDLSAPEDPPLKICISPGHPSDKGDKLFEAVINRKVAYVLEDLLAGENLEALVATNDLVAQELFSPGFKNEGEFAESALKIMTPEEKATLCNEWNADYLISIHHNHSPDDSINQTLVFYGGEEDFEPRFESAVRWADLTAAYLGKTMSTNDSQSKSDFNSLSYKLTILESALMPGILVESSYFSNPEEYERLNDNRYLDGEAEAISDALTAFLRTQKERSR